VAAPTLITATPLDLGADLLDARLDLVVVTSAINDGGVVLGDGDLLSRTQIGELDGFELLAEVVADHLAAGEGGDVFQHGLAAVAKAWGLHGADLDDVAQLVHHQRGQGFTLDLFGDDQQGATRILGRFEQGQHVLERADLLFEDEDVGVVHLDFHAVGIGHEVGAQVTTIELHAFNHFEGGLQSLGFLDGDDAFLANLLHRFGNDVTDLAVAIGRDGADLGNLCLALGGLAEVLQLVADDDHGLVDATLQLHWVVASSDELAAFAEDRLGEHSGCGGAVTGVVGSLRSDFLHHLRAHVLELVVEFDLLGNGHAVLGDGGGAKALLDHHIAALGTEGDLNGIGEGVDATQHLLAGFGIKNDGLGCHDKLRNRFG
jgi:hypothetical protein